MKDSVSLAAVQNLSDHLTEGVSYSNDKDAPDESGFLSEKECKNLRTDLKELSGSICGFCHDECAKILMALAKNKTPRDKIHTKTSERSVSNSSGTVSMFDDVDGKQIRRLSEIIDDFSSKCEMLCSKSSSSLKSAFQHQANRFLSKFHLNRKSRVNSALENECWKPTEVKNEFQHFVDNVCTSGILSKTKSFGESKTENYLLVKDEKFVVVG